MKNRYCKPETVLYELNNKYYTLDDLADFAEYKQRTELIRRSVYTVLTGFHLMAFMVGIIFSDVVDNCLLLILGIIYCFAGTVLFGLLAGGDTE